MRRHFSIISAIVLAALLSPVATCAQADNAIAKASASTAQKIVPPQRGTLYRASYRGNTCYLFGTVHVGQTAFYPLEPQVTRALSAASKLVIEVDIRDAASFQQAVMRHGVYPDGQTIDRHLSGDSTAQLKQALQKADIPFESVARLKPWMVSNVLMLHEMARSGFPSEQGLELYFLSVAKKQNKIVQALETADYQLSLFDSLTDAQQEDYLRENLAELADGTAIRKGMALIDAWRSADGKTLEAALHEMQGEKSAAAAFLQRVLLDQRNPGMANKIEALLKNDKASFVAVGALHLLGDKGVPALLQQRGYKVQKLY